MNLRIAGVVDEDPFDARTWSGSSSYFFRALKDRGALAGAVAATPAQPVRRFYQLQSFHPNKRKWRFRYHLNLNYYRKMTKVAYSHLHELGDSSFDVILQIGAWYDLTRFPGKPVISYHDGNLATLLKSPYGFPDIAAHRIQAALDYERALYGKIRLIFPMSQWLADSFIRDNGVNPRKVFPVGAGVNLPPLAPVAEKSYTAPRILFVGKDFARKGGTDLLAAFKIVRTHIKDAELTIVGCNVENPPRGVRCVGPLSKGDPVGLQRLLHEYERASIFVMPSLYEPFGIAFAEAMAHKLPCVGTSICAMPEIITEGRTGFLVSPRDAAGLASRIVDLLSSPSMCQEFGACGYDRYEKNFTWSAVTTRMLDVISAELGSPGTR